MFAKNSTATTTVSLVRFRSTMCVPPCEAGADGYLTKDQIADDIVQAILEAAAS